MGLRFSNDQSVIGGPSFHGWKLNRLELINRGELDQLQGIVPVRFAFRQRQAFS